MRKNILILLIVIAALFAAGCTSKDSITVSCDDFQDKLHISDNLKVDAGAEFTVSLCSNPTTGYQWADEAGISDTAGVEQSDHQMDSGDGGSEVVGAAGEQVWYFKANSSGTATLTFTYSQSWEGGEKGAWTYQLIVDVE